MKEIFDRRSVRTYKKKPVEYNLLLKLMEAAMAAPTAGNQQEWEFVIIKKRATLNLITKIQPYAQMLKVAPVAIAVCADLKREAHKGYWVQDCAAATQNILLEACHLGLGTCWLGIYPRQDRVKGIKEILKLPENVMPLSVIAVGYAAEENPPSDRFDQNKIHIDSW